MRQVLFATLALAASTTGALSGPWTMDGYVVDNEEFWYASQVDTTGSYRLTVYCSRTSKDYWMVVESSFPWEPTSSYAPEVPSRFVVDGVEHSGLVFQFEERDGYESIIANARPQAQAFVPLFNALVDAKSLIEVQYFDRHAEFSAEEAHYLSSAQGLCEL